MSGDGPTTDVDLDNIAMSFDGGQVTGLVVDDADGGLASCWGDGSEVLLTSPSLTFDDVETPTIASSTANPDGTTTLHLTEPIKSTSFADASTVLSATRTGGADLWMPTVTLAPRLMHVFLMHAPTAPRLRSVCWQQRGQEGTAQWVEGCFGYWHGGDGRYRGRHR